MLFVPFPVPGLRQPARYKFFVRWQGDRRVLRRPGNGLPDVPRVYHRPAGGADGHQVPMPQWHRL